MKRCKKCGELKPLSEYHKQKGGRYGVKARCRDCIYPDGKRRQSYGPRQGLMPYAEIAKRVGLSKEAVRQIEQRALEKVKKKLIERGYTSVDVSY
jgi:hypothetical protein